MANEGDTATRKDEPPEEAAGRVLPLEAPVPNQKSTRRGPGRVKRFFDALLLREPLEQARREEAQVSPERTAMIGLARDYATVADGLFDGSNDVPLAPVLTLYREAIFLLLANDWAGKKALTLAYETAPDSLLEEAVQHDPSLARIRHLLALHASLASGRPVTSEYRDVAQVTKTSVHRMLEAWRPSRVASLLRRRRARLVGAAGLLVLGLAGLASVVGHAISPTDLAAGRPWRTSSKLGEVYSAKILFHTSEETNPWFEIDLGRVKTVHALHVKNRPDSNWERAVPLLVELSSDQINWQTVAKKEFPFLVWEPSFPPMSARFVRLRVPRVTFLHLAEVRVY